MTNSMRALRVPALDAIPRLVHGFEQPGDARGVTRAQGRLRAATALRPWGRLLVMTQVHGARVQGAPWKEDTCPEGDAAVCSASGWILGIETADCLPVLVVDPRRRVGAAAHAGWRGTLAGVTGAAVAALIADGSRPEHLLAALGPCIGSCCYEVGDELRATFDAALGPAAAGFFRTGPRGRAHLDLRAANLAQLEHCGLAPTHLHTVTDCTRCRADLYPSYRRDGKGAGRMLSFVGWAQGEAAGAATSW